MSTNNAVNTSLSGQSGTGSFAGTTSPTFVTPTMGAASATSVTFSSTTGIVGTTTNNNAAAGSVGELISSVIPIASAISLSNGTAANVTTISLTAGDWDISGNVFFAGTGVFTAIDCWTSLVSAPTVPDASLLTGAASSALGNSGFVTPFLRVSIATTTTVYLGATANISTGSVTACGGIFARRVR